MVKTQIEEAKNFLSTTVIQLESYLNKTTLTALMDEKDGEEKYYSILLSNLRRLLVYCEEGLDACAMILQSEPFPKGAAEKTLYRIYHQCIEEFFSPKTDAWFEDSRSAYTGRNSIKLRKDGPDSAIQLLRALEADFQKVREELEFYETDYRTKMIQSK
jgi:hypothetical protein